MKFFDEVIIDIKAGKGGNGCISFHRAKFIPKGGPDGGNGGKGGNIYFISNNNINNLNYFHNRNTYISENGFKGQNSQCTGKNGKDLIIQVPIGTKIIDMKKKIVLVFLKKNKQIFLAAKGGNGGLGNINFKSSINRTPYKRTKGYLGQKKKIKLEFILKADISVLGLPNSGKSTFIKKISSANTKIGNYFFTTTKPILGVIKNKLSDSYISILDVPSIIKKSSIGKGLGLNFIKHFKYCKLLLHFIDVSSIDEKNNISTIIDIINFEIIKFNKKLLLKEQWLIFNKIDLLNNKNKLIYYIDKTLIKYKFIKKFYLISSIRNIGIKKLYIDILKYFYK
ncbi:Obg family GTPase CgtA [Enterobacteriaceae endosymbiont of Donacia thalassina]|uniref:Obg family GTPase CgtA n=1 Tax=Enterobacteriaceae endosymbiont of Donacia thalassina TaxID=2675786 RepID=UPI001449DDD6|nr:Obg family GTPase CgtA [Enterobacteriaceae endosymbiont of Donacia thalassina]QJC37535.1 Obg family GTPase CgtA [Enterobacteriaceae endosymbiont of Donacia thalassina]